MVALLGSKPIRLLLDILARQERGVEITGRFSNPWALVAERKCAPACIARSITMAPSEPLFRADRDRVLIQIARRTAFVEYDRRIIENTQQIIQRSRELLERTKHQVLPPSQRV